MDSNYNERMDDKDATVLFSEVLTKVNNAKDKLSKRWQYYNNMIMVKLRQVLKGAFDPNIEWDLQQVAHIL